MGKTLIIIGLVFIVAGIITYFLPGNGLPPRLPGDIHIKQEGVSFYFPLGWSVVISIVLSLAYWLFGKH